MRILALESSCDESAVAVYDDAAGLLSHEIHSQIDLHRIYGGVVPELASRDHVRRLLPLVRTALADAQYPADRDRWRRLHRGARAHRRAADRSRARPLAGVRVERAGHRRSSPGRTPAGAAARASPAAVSAPRAAGVRRAHDAHRRGGVRRNTRCSARRATTRPARPSTRSAKLLGLPYPGGPELAKLAARRQRRNASISRGPCWIAPGSSSASRD